MWGLAFSFVIIQNTTVTVLTKEKRQLQILGAWNGAQGDFEDSVWSREET